MNTVNSTSQRLWTFVMGVGLAAYATLFVLNGVGGFA